MLADIFSLLSDLTAVVLTGFVIKMMDDYLDFENDLIVGRYSIVQTLGVGTVVYALMIFAIAVSLQAHFSIALLFASYMAGMLCDLRQRLPTKLKGWQEIVIVGVLSKLFVGFNDTVVALCCMIFVQVIDDWLDQRIDERTGQRNLFRLLGYVEAWLCGFIAFLIAFMLNPYLTNLVVIAAVIIWYLFRRLETKGGLQ